VNAWRDCEMGEDRIRHFVFVCGRWRWRTTATMGRHGFELITMGRGGPDLDSKGRPVPSPVDKTRAIVLNADWDKVRTGAQEAAEKVYPPGSVWEASKRAMLLRAAERKEEGHRLDEGAGEPGRLAAGLEVARAGIRRCRSQDAPAGRLPHHRQAVQRQRPDGRGGDARLGDGAARFGGLSGSAWPR
jgi:hypothetical protein